MTSSFRAWVRLQGLAVSLCEQTEAGDAQRVLVAGSIRCVGLLIQLCVRAGSLLPTLAGMGSPLNTCLEAALMVRSQHSRLDIFSCVTFYSLPQPYYVLFYLIVLCVLYCHFMCILLSNWI